MTLRAIESHFERLPEEILLEIFDVLDFKDLGRLSTICQKFNKIANSPFLWKKKCLIFWEEKELGCKGPRSKSLEQLVECANEIESCFNWKWFGRVFALQNFIFRDPWNYFGNIDGKGVATSVGGAIYVGEFQNGKRHGIGAYYYPLGQICKGSWKDDQQDGEGTMSWPDGDCFKGMWRDGKRNGNGIMTWLKADFKYEGEFANDDPVDEEACLHSKVRDAVHKDLCTSIATGETELFGQFYFYCKDCQLSYCIVCHEKCHQDRFHNWQRKRWSPGIFCYCVKNDSCQKKKRKIVYKQCNLSFL